MVTASNLKYFQFIAEDSEISLLEKSNPIGAVTKEDIADALYEYEQQFRMGQISKAELLTLHRAHPSNQEYAQAALTKGLIGDEASNTVVIGGPASVEMVDREGHLITMNAMSKAFDKYMASNRTRNVMVLHSDVQVGWALPAYINASGQIFKSGVNDDRLFLLSEIRDDTKISQRVIKQIEDGKLHSYSIAGSAISTQTIQKGMVQYMQVDELELAEITVCEQGVNQGSNFDLLKGQASGGTCIDGSCLTHLEKQEISFEMEPVELIYKEDGNVDFFLTLEHNYTVTGIEGNSFTTLQNEGGRRELHSHFLRELGFPEEVHEDSMRFAPVSEESPLSPWRRKPAINVNEAGSEMSVFSPTPSHGDLAGLHSNQIGMTKSAVDSFLDWNKQN